MHQTDIKLSKSDFILYLLCQKSFWLTKHKPREVPEGEFSAFRQKLAKEGYEIERYVRELFDQKFANSVTDFQRTFETDSGLTARADVVEFDDLGQCNLFEVKSSTRVKREPKHDHLKDACFQLITAERSGQAINRVSIIHVNGDYVRDGEIDPTHLLVFADVTDEVRAIQEEIEHEIDAALSMLASAEIDESSCGCLEKSRANHCDTFAYFNPNVPTPSIYSLPRLSQKKRADLVGRGIFNLEEIPEDYPLSEPQSALLKAAQSGMPIIDQNAVREFLDNLEFPLWFYDFESYMSAVPIVDGASPHSHLPFQYSLDMLDESGSLEHYEYLSPIAQLPDELIRQMKAHFGRSGNAVVWHAPFEKSRNSDMATAFPEHADFLEDLNQRTVDLEDPFKQAYVDSRFDGSSSIKNVLPVVCPQLSYKGLDVADGTAAMEAWSRMVHPETSVEERAALEASLTQYCALDTMAMVEIYRFLCTLA